MYTLYTDIEDGTKGYKTTTRKRGKLTVGGLLRQEGTYRRGGVLRESAASHHSPVKHDVPVHRRAIPATSHTLVIAVIFYMDDVSHL